ncbi:aminoacyl-tRNA hydrolase, partial [Salmonella enterica subsp. enterica serovar Poona]
PNLLAEALDEAARGTDLWFKEGLAKATSRLHTFKAQ